MTRTTRILGLSSAMALAAISALHVIWATGSTFPFRDALAMADTVAGTTRPPAVPETLAVAGSLAAAAALVADVAPLPRPLQRLGVAGVVGVLAVRGGLGLMGRTEVLVSWKPSERFVELDRRYYAPLCLVLAGGAAASLCD